MSTQSSFVYLNDRFVPREQATLDVEDRGTMFADGVYEVLRYFNGKPFALEPHLDRLRNSLREIYLDDARIDDLPQISDELIHRNDQPDAAVYWQITRGPAVRNRAIPQQVKPTLLVMCWPAPPLEAMRVMTGRTVIVAPDRRWHRCHIKSLMLLDNVLSKHLAAQHGVDDVIYARDGIVTESTASNVFLVRDGALWTHPADEHILPGITRAVVIELARELGIAVKETRFGTDVLALADEVFVTGTTTNISPVSHVDGRVLPAVPGPTTQRLHEALLDRIEETCCCSARG